RTPAVEIAGHRHRSALNVGCVQTNQHAARIGFCRRQRLRLASSVEPARNADAPTSPREIPVQRIGRLPADAAPQRKSIGQRDIDTSAPCRIVEAAAEPLAGLQPGLHWRAAISQTTDEKGIETLTRADPARIAF